MVISADRIDHRIDRRLVHMQAKRKPGEINHDNAHTIFTTAYRIGLCHRLYSWLSVVRCPFSLIRAVGWSTDQQRSGKGVESMLPGNVS